MAKPNKYGGIMDVPNAANKSLSHDRVEYKAYISWYNMLKRCYDDKYHLTHPTYKDCTVCKEWFIFSNYLKWFKKEYFIFQKTWGTNTQHSLDKYLKSSREYSPNSCCLIPLSENVRERNYRLGPINTEGAWKRALKESNKVCKRKVNIYDSNKNFIKECDSVKEASEFGNTYHQAISRNCKRNEEGLVRVLENFYYQYC